MLADLPEDDIVVTEEIFGALFTVETQTTLKTRCDWPTGNHKR